MKRGISIISLILLGIIFISGCGTETTQDNVTVINGVTPGADTVPVQPASNETEELIVEPEPEEPVEIVPGDPLYVHYVDVVGDSSFIVAPNDRMLVINGGDPNTAGYLVSYLRTYVNYTRRIDATIATGPGTGQIGGIGTVMFNMGVWEAYDSNISENTNLYTSYEGFATQYTAYRYPVRNNTMIYLDRDVQIEIISPYGKNGISEVRDDNSLLIWMYYLETSFLFTGDCNKECQKRVIDYKALDVDVLQVPQGGNNDALSDEFLDKVSPKIIIVSDKDRPASQAFLDRMAARGIEVHQVSEEGAIVVKSDGYNYDITCANDKA